MHLTEVLAPLPDHQVEVTPVPRDRYGEPIDPEDLDEQPVHPYRCRRSGWIDRDADHPVPCLECKPHLARPAVRHDRSSREEASR
jgi:hypothetical protein